MTSQLSRPLRQKLLIGHALRPCRLAGMLFCVGWAALFGSAIAAAEAAAPGAKAGLSVTSDVRQVTSWIRATDDHHGQAFAIIDKKAAMLHMFDAAGTLRGSSPVLLGLAVGDESVPGIGERKLSDIRPEERTTPAGRFASEPGRNLQNDDIVWIDYHAAVSMHRGRAGGKGDRRLERLATPTPDDNRISYGCVNVPAAFYDALVKPLLGSAPGVIYVLPETRPVDTILKAAGSASPHAARQSAEPL